MIAVCFATACATVIEGTSQIIAIYTTPEGAACTLSQNGKVIGSVASTPATISVAKSKYDLVVMCAKQGYVLGTSKNHSDQAATALANGLLGGFSIVGNVTDSISGASNKYDSVVTIALERLDNRVNSSR